MTSRSIHAAHTVKQSSGNLYLSKIALISGNDWLVFIVSSVAKDVIQT